MQTIVTHSLQTVANYREGNDTDDIYDNIIPCSFLSQINSQLYSNTKKSERENNNFAYSSSLTIHVHSTSVDCGIYI